jgi:hypothetical protein
MSFLPDVIHFFNDIQKKQYMCLFKCTEMLFLSDIKYVVLSDE